MKTIDDILNDLNDAVAAQNGSSDAKLSSYHLDMYKKIISEMVKEIIGELEDEVLPNAPYSNKRNLKLRNRLKRVQIVRAKERGIDI